MIAKKEKNTKFIPWILVIIISVAIYFYVQSQTVQTATIHLNQLFPLDSTFNVTSVFVQNNAPPGTAAPDHIIKSYAYVAQTPQQQEQGYMNQTWLGDCDKNYPCIGMLFLIGNQSNICFWMKNTKIPLKQIWVASNETVVYIYNATPYSSATACSPGAVVLETNQNFTINVGDKVVIGS